MSGNINLGELYIPVTIISAIFINPITNLFDGIVHWKVVVELINRKDFVRIFCDKLEAQEYYDEIISKIER